MRRLAITFLVAMLTVGIWSISSWGSPGDELWQYPTAGGYERQTYIAIDSSGNRVMATTVATGGLYYCSIVSVDKNGQYNWSRTYRGDAGKAQARGVSIDSQGNIAVIGIVWNGSDWDWAVLSYTASGGQRWVKTYDSGKDDGTVAVAIDTNGNVVVAGYEYISAEGYNWRVISYSSESGAENWHATYDKNHKNDKPRAIAVDSHNNVIVGGYVNNGATNDWMVISYSPTGGTKWTQIYDSSKDDGVNAVAVDTNDNVLVAGYEYTNSYDWRVVSYDSSGNRNWVKTYNSGNGHDSTRAIAVDSQGNVVVAGYESNGSDYDWRVISYASDGSQNWSKGYDGNKDDGTWAVAIDPHGNAIVAGYTYTSDYDWRVVSYSPSGDQNWVATYDSGNMHDSTSGVAIDKTTGDPSVAGYTQSHTNALIVNYEGSGGSGRVLIPSEVRTINPAPENPDPAQGKYLGFGDVVSGGTKFKVEAAFPTYLKQSDNSVLAVKIFIATQMPDDYSRLAYFDSSNNLKYQPPEKLSSWKATVSGEVAKTTVMSEIDVTSASSSIPSGTHYWYTLVVPDTVPDDFAGVDWATTPWEITVNIFDVQ